MWGKVDAGEQRIRLKSKVAATLSCGNGELMKVFQQRKGMMGFSL